MGIASIQLSRLRQRTQDLKAQEQKLQRKTEMLQSLLSDIKSSESTTSSIKKISQKTYLYYYIKKNKIFFLNH